MPPRAFFRQSGQNVRIAGAPDQVRTQGDGFQVHPVCRQHEALSRGLGLGVGRLEVRCYGQGLVAALDVAADMNDAGGTGVDQVFNTVFEAALEHVLGAADIDGLVVGNRAPDTRLGSGVDDRVAISRGHDQVPLVADVALQHLDTDGFQFGSRGALKGGHLVALLTELAADCAAEETPASGDEDFHLGVTAASWPQPSRPVPRG